MKITAEIRSPTMNAEAYRATLNESVYDEYTGDYIVTPQTTEQMLETSDKLMTDDVTVKAIPYYEVTNENGTTVIIGGK